MATVVFKTYDDLGEIREVEMDTDEMRLNRMKRRLETWETALRRSIDAKLVKVMAITLTYDTNGTRTGKPASWEPRHISDLMKKIRKHCGDKLLGYCWVAELQERGVIHYHLLLVLEPRTYIPYLDQEGWWPWGMTEVKPLKRVSSSYLTKYVQKGLEGRGRLPKGARMFACVLRMELEDFERFFFKLSAAVGHVRRKMGDLWQKQLDVFPFDGWSWKPRDGGGWLIKRNHFQLISESTSRMIEILPSY